MTLFGMTLMQLCATLSSFSLFAVVVYRMLDARYPCFEVLCVSKWVCNGLLHGLVGVGVLWWWTDTWRNPGAGEWHLCMIRSGVALLLLAPLLRSSASRDRATDRRSLP